MDRVVQGFNQAYALDQSYRTENSGVGLLSPAAGVMQANIIPMQGPPTAEMNRTSLPMHFGELTVTAIEVNHDPAEPAYGYRFDYRGRSAVVSGDTNYHPPLAVVAEGADVLVHEAQSEHLVQLIQKAATQAGSTRIAQTMGDIQHYHTDPLDAARIANQAHVHMLVLTHLDPPLANPLLYRMFYRRMSDVRSGDWISGADGTLITLPVGSNQLLISQLKH